MYAIEVDGLTKRFNGHTAVNGVTFNVEKGEVFGVLGPNGAGKSTLINMLVTLLAPTDGTALVNGYSIREQKNDVRASLGIVFQEEALDEELTGAENLEFHARLYGLNRERMDNRVDEVLDLVGLMDVRDLPVDKYSGGMKRRLEIARGLVSEPAVLFLDEPTVGLDARTRRETWRYINRMNTEEDVSIVLTTHYIEEADNLCSRVAIMDEGDIVAIDDPTSLKSGLGGDVVVLEVDERVEELGERLSDESWVNGCTVADPGLHVTLTNGETRVVDIVRITESLGIDVASVEVRKPSLEDVFLDLTGSRIDEATREDDTVIESEEERLDAAD